MPWELGIKRATIVGTGRKGKWLVNVLKEDWDIAVYDADPNKRAGILGWRCYRRPVISAAIGQTY
ncbi:MAG: hypothetical protein LVQ63_01055 [Thermoplasmatales archaeon]|nr:hypothetical protein [Thermoplasmatales archaeon]